MGLGCDSSDWRAGRPDSDRGTALCRRAGNRAVAVSRDTPPLPQATGVRRGGHVLPGDCGGSRARRHRGFGLLAPRTVGGRLFEVTQFGACSGHHQTPRSCTKVSALRWCLFPGPGSQALGVPLSGSPGSPGGGSHQRFPSLTLELFVEQGLAPGQWAWPCTQRAQLRLQWGEWGRAPARRAPVSKFRGALPGGSWTAWLEGTPRAGGSAPPTDPN